MRKHVATKSPDRFKPKLVIALHGIRTPARWQKTLAEVFSTPAVGIPTKLWDYGFYPGLKFLLGWPNQQMIDKFVDVYRDAVNQRQYEVDCSDYTKRPSVIAHSFGTYILGYCMLKYEEVRFDKVLLCGSILPGDFDWFTLFARDQVNRVRNEFGTKDFWAKVVGKFVAGTGSSGQAGFDAMSSMLEQPQFEFFRHSDYFQKSHIESHWVSYFMREPSNLKVKHGREIENTAEFTRITNVTGPVIDTACFGGLSHYDDVEIPRGLSLEWIKINPDIYTFLMDRRNHPKGYINAMPVTEELFSRIKAGEINDNEIGADGIEPFTQDAVLRMYLMSIAIAPELHKTGKGLFQPAFELLLNGFVEKLIYYAQMQRVRVSELVSVGWTPQGKKLCQMFGMREVAKDKFGNPVFWVDLTKSLMEKRHSYPALRRLAQVYSQMPR